MLYLSYHWDNISDIFFYNILLKQSVKIILDFDSVREFIKSILHNSSCVRKKWETNYVLGHIWEAFYTVVFLQGKDALEEFLIVDQKMGQTH